MNSQDHTHKARIFDKRMHATGLPFQTFSCYTPIGEERSDDRANLSEVFYVLVHASRYCDVCLVSVIFAMPR